MTLNIKFKKINLGPRNIDPLIKLELNGHNIYYGKVLSEITQECKLLTTNTLRIYFVNKTDLDTEVDNDQIINDMSFELDEIVIDNVKFGDLLWIGKYHSEHHVFDGCLFFGPKGYYEISFQSPVLKWQLKTQHESKGSDPTWEEDYNYYITACKILDNKSIT
jgi:hypothetical protein